VLITYQVTLSVDLALDKVHVVLDLTLDVLQKLLYVQSMDTANVLITYQVTLSVDLALDKVGHLTLGPAMVGVVVEGAVEEVVEVEMEVVLEVQHQLQFKPLQLQVVDGQVVVEEEEEMAVLVVDQDVEEEAVVEDPLAVVLWLVVVEVVVVMEVVEMEGVAVEVGAGGKKGQLWINLFKNIKTE